ncbi:MAG: hypothetical protein AAF517_28705, partial [Planctomycetota bacterium]
GNQNGAPLLLRQRPGYLESDSSGLPEDERELVRLARKRHHSTKTWLAFNAWVALNVLLWAPLEELLFVALIATWVYAPIDPWILTAITPLAYFGLGALHALFVCAMKWIVVGRYRAGNYAYYGAFHHKWVMMMALADSVDGFASSLHGTAFARLYNQLLGAKIGSDVYLHSDSLESDLLTIGPQTSVNEDCDITCHTVENMVLKLAPVQLGDRSTLRSYSVVMPGGTMEERSTLLEQSQVLKGETVNSDSVWAGLPARRL